MSVNVTGLLNQGYRDALLSYYIGNYVPAKDLDSLISTPEDVYEYLLIDPLVNNDVQTSRVAQAMSSIQQYINSITLNMEPGYNTQVLDANEITEWNAGANQYSIWGGGVELDTYPENYLDPGLRNGKSSSFIELESMLNQSSLTDSAEQSYVLGYLSEFENIANLDIVSGYLDGISIPQSIYYFIGKTRTAPYQYYFRTLDMRNRVDGVIPFSAWSEWIEIAVSFNADAVVGTIRPILFNNRLYVIWYEKTITGQQEDGSDIVTLKAYSSCYNFDKTWSAPNVLVSVDSQQENDPYKNLFDCEDPSQFYTIAVHVIPADTSVAESLAVCLYTDYNQTDGYTDLSIKIDYWFNQPTITPNFFSDFYDDYKGDGGQKKIQYIWSMTSFSVTVTEDESFDSFTESDIVNNLSLTADDITITDSSAIIKSSFAASSLNYDISHLDATGTANVSGGVPLRFQMTFDFQHPSIHVDGTIVATSGNFYTQEKIISIQVDNLTSGINGSEHDISGNSSQQSDTQITISGAVFQAPEIDFNYDDNYKITFRSKNSGSSAMHNTYIVNSFKFPRPAYYWSLQAYKDSWGSGEVLAEYSDYGLAENQTIQTDEIENLSELTTMIYYYGVKRESSPEAEAYKKFTINFSPATGKMNAGEILSTNETAQGQAKYLSLPDNSSVRLNTLFARELINKASISIDELLTWDTQLTVEPSLEEGGTPVPMDFNGANGLYFWELFFHMPWLVAHRLYQEGQYNDAQSWLNYIFDPSARGRVSSNPAYPEPDYWNVRPLVEAPTGETQSSMVMDPLDPDAIAVADPVHYQKAIFMAYISNLIAAADADYRLLTNDGLSQAKLRYCQVLDLLGARPDIQLMNKWQPDTLANIASASDTTLSAFATTSTMDLLSMAGETGVGMAVIDNANFSEPLNTYLLNFWNTVDSRLFNLRHNLSIDGQPLNIPLYAPLANPTLLMQQYAQGGSLSNAAATLAMTIPPYRFSTMLQSAKSAVGTLSQLGQTLLNYYDQGDAKGLQELQQQQALDISAFTLQLQQQSLEALNADATALQASRAIAQQRYDHYYRLYDEGVSDSEQQVMNMQTTSGSMMTAAGSLFSAGAAMNMVPNIFGLADGGSVWGAAVTAAGSVLQTSAEATNVAAQRIAISEEYRRRSEEWQIQYQQAQSEMTAIDKQLDALSIRQQAAQTSLQQAQQQQADLQATMSYLTTRFTQSSLYNWLCGQLSALYCQAYDAVLSLCLSAQSCWQYEMGDMATTFIQTGAWNDSYHGLLVGETLTLNLQQMESAWLSRHQRRLELTRTVSLKQLLGDDFADLINKGLVSFTLNESLFDNDYPGHYLRQIKYITLSLPTLVGPYQDIRATLTQTSSSTLLKADINGVKYLNGDTSSGNATNIVTNLRASQQIAISSGMNDSGLFMLSFGDERYLPFEGTGAISSWQLAFPRYMSDEQQAILAALNDAIVQVHYTAIYGGSAFEQAVEAGL